MADIKTRDTVKGTIKTLNKAAIAGQKMKQAYIATKDKAEYSICQRGHGSYIVWMKSRRYSVN